MRARISKLLTAFLVAALLMGQMPVPARGEAAAGYALEWQPLNEPGSGGQFSSIVVSPHDGNKVFLSGDMLGLGVSTDGGETWNRAMGFLDGQIHDVTFHPENPQIVWAGSSTGPYVSYDGGFTFSQKVLPLPSGNPWGSLNGHTTIILKVLYDPGDPTHETLLAFSGNHRRLRNCSLYRQVWRSTDGGETWLPYSIVSGSYTTTSAAADTLMGVQVDSQGNFYAAVSGTNGGVWKSTDGGLTWVQKVNGLPDAVKESADQIIIHPTDDNILYVSLEAKSGVGGGVFKSTDAAETWIPVNNGLNQAADSRYYNLAISKSKPQVLVTGDHGPAQLVYRTTDGGANWTLIQDKQDVYSSAYWGAATLSCVTIHPEDENIIFTGSSCTLLKSVDGGETWKNVTAVQVGNDPDLNAGVGYSGLCARGIFFNPRDPDNIAITSMDQGKVIISYDGGLSWYSTANGHGTERYKGAVSVTFGGPDGSTVYSILGQGNEFRGIGKSTDKGRTWVVLTGDMNGYDDRGNHFVRGSGLPNLGSSDEYIRNEFIYTLPDNPDVVWAAINGSLYKSTDGGSNWWVPGLTNGICGLANDIYNPHVFYVLSNAGIYKVEDSPDHATDTYTLLPGSPAGGNFMAVDNSGTRFYVAKYNDKPNEGITDEYGLFIYDGSDTVRSNTDIVIPYSSNGVYDVTVDPFYNNRVLLITHGVAADLSLYSGVYMSEDGGMTWKEQNRNLDVLRTITAKFDPRSPGKVYIGTGGSGFYVSDIYIPPTQARLIANPSSAVYGNGLSQTFQIYLSRSSALSSIGVQDISLGGVLTGKTVSDVEYIDGSHISVTISDDIGMGTGIIQVKRSAMANGYDSEPVTIQFIARPALSGSPLTVIGSSDFNESFSLSLTGDKVKTSIDPSDIVLGGVFAGQNVTGLTYKAGCGGVDFNITGNVIPGTGTISISGNALTSGLDTEAISIVVENAPPPILTATPDTVMASVYFQQSFDISISTDLIKEGINSSHIILGGALSGLTVSDVNRHADGSLVAIEVTGSADAGTGTISIDADALDNGVGSQPVSITLMRPSLSSDVAEVEPSGTSTVPSGAFNRTFVVSSIGDTLLGSITNADIEIGGAFAGRHLSDVIYHGGEGTVSLTITGDVGPGTGTIVIKGTALTNGIDSSPLNIHVSAAEPAFYDDFEDTNLTYSSWTTLSGNFTVEDGKFKAYKGASSGFNRAMAGSDWWTDYSVSARIKVTEKWGLVGLIARVSDVNNYYFFVLDNTDKILLRKMVNGSAGNIKAGNTVTLDMNKEYIFKLVVEGNAISGFIINPEDDSVIASISGEDSALEAGRAGLHANIGNQHSASSEVFYDDILVEGLN